MRPAQVDAVIRVYDLADLPGVRSCLFTLLAQMRSGATGGLTESLHIHLMTQRFTASEMLALRNAVADLLQLDDEIGLTLHNWDYRDPFDLRVPLLNMALDVTHGRYVTFLDSTDLLCAGALEALVGHVRSGEAVAALGGISRQCVRWWGDTFLPCGGAESRTTAALLLVDRSKLNHRVSFQVAPPGSEIDVFVGSLRGHGRIDEHYLNEPLCVRHVFQ